MNLDGAVTISDVWLWVKWLWYLPGDFFIIWLSGNMVGRFFEVSGEDVGGNGSFTLSMVLWLILLMLVAALLEEIVAQLAAVRQFLTSAVVRKAYWAERDSRIAREAAEDLRKPFYQRRASGLVLFTSFVALFLILVLA
jgi:hypothetical protein